MNNADFLKSVMPFVPERYLSKRKEPLRKAVYPYRIGVEPIIYKNHEPENVQFVTSAELIEFCPSLTIPKADALSGMLNHILPQYELDEYDIFHEFIANVAHESDRFRRKSENLNYSAKRLAEVWPSRFSATKGKPYKPNEKANKIAKNPELIANEVYANRMGNRSPKSGDGWRNRGSGFMMLTGASMAKLYGKYCGVSADMVMELCRTRDDYALDSACWYFCVYKNLKDLAIKDEIEQIRKDINGGLIGIDDVMDLTKSAESIWPIW